MNKLNKIVRGIIYFSDDYFKGKVSTTFKKWFLSKKSPLFNKNGLAEIEAKRLSYNEPKQIEIKERGFYKLLIEIMGFKFASNKKLEITEYCKLGEYLPCEMANGFLLFDIIKNYYVKIIDEKLYRSDEFSGHLDLDNNKTLSPEKEKFRNEIIKRRIPTYEDFCAFLRDSKENLYTANKPLSFEEWKYEVNWQEVPAYKPTFHESEYTYDDEVFTGDTTYVDGSSYNSGNEPIKPLPPNKQSSSFYDNNGYFLKDSYEQAQHDYRVAMRDYSEAKTAYNKQASINKQQRRQEFQRQAHQEKQEFQQRQKERQNQLRYDRTTARIRRTEEKAEHIERVTENKKQAKLQYERYCSSFKSFSVSEDVQKNVVYQFLQNQVPSVANFLQYYKPNPESYLEFLKSLCRNFPSLSLFFQKQTALIPEKAREAHTYIVGGSGSGKSELMKYMIHHYGRTPQKSVVILDPHGDFCQQIARHSSYIESGRVIYLDFSNRKNIVGFNPLQLPDRKEETIDFYLQHLTRAIQEICGELSVNMETVVKNCLAVLLRREDSTLRDLQIFMHNEENAHLIREGKRHPTNESIRGFFKKGFIENSDYQRTRNSISTRFQSLFVDTHFLNIITQANSFDLEKAVNSGKIVICNLSITSLGESVSETLGRMIIAQLAGIARRREPIPQNKRPHTHVFVDECQLFLSASLKKIFEQLRKYKMMLTIASQSLDQLTGEMQNAVLANTNVKILGSGSISTMRLLAEEMGLSPESIEHIELGQWHVRVKRHKYPFSFRVPTDYLDDKGQVNDREWQKFLQDQYKKYYRSFKPKKAEDFEKKQASPKDIFEEENKRKKGFRVDRDI